MNPDPGGESLAELRNFYDHTDQSAELDDAELDGSTVEDPMVGITVRLPASTLGAARAIAAERGVKVTALLREYVEHQLADQIADEKMVPVAELRRLIAHAGG
jgi:hypothetical protein